MEDKFKVGDKVFWNSESGKASGAIIKIHYEPFKVHGYTRHATKVNPQYAIKSLISDHIAHHFASALRLIKKPS